MTDDADQQRMMRMFMARVQPPDSELPVVIPLMVQIGRTWKAAVQLTCVEVYSAALMVHVDVRARPGSRLPVMGPAEAVDGGLVSPNGDHRLVVTAQDGAIADSWLHRYPRQNRSVDRGDSVPGEREMTIFIGGHGGGSQERGYQRRISYWLTPRPPGPLVLTLEWTALGIGPSRTPLSADELDRSTALVPRLWA